MGTIVGVTLGVGVGGFGGSVRDPGMGSIDTPSVVVGVGAVVGIGAVEVVAVGLGGIGIVLTGGGAWAVDIGTSKNPCRVNRTIALKQLRASQIDRLE